MSTDGGAAQGKGNIPRFRESGTLALCIWVQVGESPTPHSFLLLYDEITEENATAQMMVQKK